MPEVMDADIAEPGGRPDALPGLLDTDEMSVAALGGQNVWATFPVRQLGQREGGRPERNRLLGPPSPIFCAAAPT